MRSFLRVVIFGGMVAFWAGCSTGVVPAGPQTYMVSRSIGGLSTGAAAKAALYREAHEWCARQGLVMVPLSTDAQEPVVGRGMGSAELTFRALRPGDPEIRRANVERPDYIQRVQVR